MTRGNDCEVDDGPIWEVIIECDCGGGSNVIPNVANLDCQLTYHPDHISACGMSSGMCSKYVCKPSANETCKAAITAWAEAYRSASNANDPECKDQDPNYKSSQNTDIDCNSVGTLATYCFLLS